MNATLLGLFIAITCLSAISVILALISSLKRIIVTLACEEAL
jgi:biopolymer transport protein ExbB/TolQ